MNKNRLCLIICSIILVGFVFWCAFHFSLISFYLGPKTYIQDLCYYSVQIPVFSYSRVGVLEKPHFSELGISHWHSFSLTLIQVRCFIEIWVHHSSSSPWLQINGKQGSIEISWAFVIQTRTVIEDRMKRIIYLFIRSRLHVWQVSVESKYVVVITCFL